MSRREGNEVRGNSASAWRLSNDHNVKAWETEYERSSDLSFNFAYFASFDTTSNTTHLSPRRAYTCNSQIPPPEGLIDDG